MTVKGLVNNMHGLAHPSEQNKHSSVPAESSGTPKAGDDGQRLGQQHAWPSLHAVQAEQHRSWGWRHVSMNSLFEVLKVQGALAASNSV